MFVCGWGEDGGVPDLDSSMDSLVVSLRLGGGGGGAFIRLSCLLPPLTIVLPAEAERL